MRDNFREASNDCGYHRRLIEPKLGLGQTMDSLYSNRLDKALPIEDTPVKLKFTSSVKGKPC